MNAPASKGAIVSRLGEAFARAKAEGRTALVCYLMGGDPDLAGSEALLLALDQAGADVIEVGIPFSDPIADGPTLQAASMRALAGGASVKALLASVGRLRGRLRAPLVAMGYMNPIEAMGGDRFAKAAAEAGFSGCIVPDLPLEESAPLRDALLAQGIELVPLVAPTTGKDRLAAIARTARGFIYTVTVTGVTGARAELPPDLAERLRELRALSPVPVAAGFGISRPEHAAALKGLADGVVVGDALFAAHHAGGVTAAAALARALRDAL
ncbi:MAG: tryptophan synthase subunit alpha [Myxococcales bacterium]